MDYLAKAELWVSVVLGVIVAFLAVGVCILFDYLLNVPFCVSACIFAAIYPIWRVYSVYRKIER